MGDLVNLNKARKARDRAGRQAEAAANRVRHGRTGAEKAADARAEARRRALLDGARLAPAAPGPGGRAGEADD